MTRPRSADPDREAAAPSRVAVVEKRGKFIVAEPFFGPGPRRPLTRDSRYGVGDLVLLRADRGAGAGGGRSGGGRSGGGRHGRQVRDGARTSVARRIGRPDNARDVLEALLLDRGLPRAFDPAVEREARLASETPLAIEGRRDLRDLATFTIDPETARDFDDAISAQAAPGGGWTVWVHIADVSAYVPPRSLVDREAYRRATSVYVPGKVEPMLPGELSNSACSLVPGEDRLAVTVEMTIGERGVKRAAFHRSVIRSDMRLDYGRVDAIFAGLAQVAEPWGEPLGAARAAAAALGALRAASGALALDSAEPSFRFDRAGNVRSLEAETQTESHRLIEHLMIAANEAVARHLEARKVPALFRVHERPESEAVRRLADQLASLGVPALPLPAGPMTPQQAADAAGELSQAVAAWARRADGRGALALTRLVLRSLKQAVYDTRNRGHSGLQSASYCHFTSPIRRYPDLICHRALLSTLGGLEPAPEAGWVAGAAPWCSTRERAAMVIERDADDIARCFLLERQLFEKKLGPVFEAEVVGLIGAGAFCAFGDGFEGMVPVRRLKSAGQRGSGDGGRHELGRSVWWELNEEGTMLVGERGGAIRLGDMLSVRVNGIDVPRGRVDLTPATPAE